MATESKQNAYSYETFTAFLKSKQARLLNVVELYSIDEGSGEVICCERIPDLFEHDEGVYALVNFLGHNQPKAMIVVQTRSCESAEPTEDDIYYTKKIYLYLVMSSIKFVDHIIVTPQNIFSFKKEGLMDEIAEFFHKLKAERSQG